VPLVCQENNASTHPLLRLHSGTVSPHHFQLNLNFLSKLYHPVIDCASIAKSGGIVFPREPSRRTVLDVALHECGSSPHYIASAVALFGSPHLIFWYTMLAQLPMVSTFFCINSLINQKSQFSR